ncbi:transcriptional regulator [Dyadobacter sp. 22481]|uniref:transcriptional regulator n=1 Tax=Dyadobacter sp. 22481 TaxID=3453926 RepID=UPI003F84FE24
MKRAKITYKVTNDEEQADLLEKVGALMKINSANTTREERQHIRAMGEALMAYEQSIYPIPEPSSLEDILEQRMYDMRCDNQDLAQTLGISQEELEMIISGDQKPDVSLLKVIRDKLDIPADFILDHV